MLVSYRNQSTDLEYKSSDRFLWGVDFSIGGVSQNTLKYFHRMYTVMREECANRWKMKESIFFSFFRRSFLMTVTLLSTIHLIKQIYWFYINLCRHNPGKKRKVADACGIMALQINLFQSNVPLTAKPINVFCIAN